ncbi:MAG: SusC/RagA family TonB-linked outer membrane protein [Tannerellaceae bacterium]|jgi:TonB-linked SusC/RagA family outer membrane protein|nr:SusC/RagA family TonB-linked outer membrane protein [Tannerellaceae bacterium]
MIEFFTHRSKGYVSALRRGSVAVLLVLFFSAGLYGQNAIRGKIVDEAGVPVSGATVQVKNARAEGAVADIDGNFNLSTQQRLPVTIVVSYVGFTAEEFVVRDARAAVNIILKENVEALNEVVVTAGGLFRARREQGYATVKITDSELIAGKSPSLAGGLTAKIPGLQVNAISSGVNPNYRLVLRGNRSINGNNQALIVVDNAIVSNDFLNNINPNDIDNIQVLNGASGSALYGSEASNGVLLITTKAGHKGKAQIRVSNTTTMETVSFFPKLQERFGQGSEPYQQTFDPIENQQYGDAFDGSIRNLGYPLADGSQLTIPYSPAKNGRNTFWETGIQNQSDISFSFGNDNIQSYVSAQYFSATGTTPGDNYDRIMVRFNNTQKLLNNLTLSYSASYTENNYDISNYTSAIYDRLIQMSANIPVTDFKDWRNNKYAHPEGWYNPWYPNPYWTADNYRADRKDTYLTGRAELKWNIFPWLHVLYRASLANRYFQAHEHAPGFQFSDYAIKTHTKGNISSFVLDIQRNRYRLNQDVQVGLNKTFGDISVNATLGWSHFNDNRKNMVYEATGLLIPGLFNINNRLNDANIPRVDTEYFTGIRSGANPNDIVKQRNYGVWADVVLGYKNFAFLHLSGRNDRTSLLAPENREYFYPAADASFIATDAIDALREHSVLDYLKIRAGLSQVGNVNIDPYDITPVYNSTVGFSTGTYFRSGDKLVLDLKPEITTGWEIGTEFRLLKNLAEVQLTYYHSSTTGQTIEASIARSTGFHSMLINTGEVTNNGIETSLRLNPIRTKDVNLSLGINYTYNKNKLVSLYGEGDNEITALGVNGSSVVFAIKDYEINQIYVSDYNRVPKYKNETDPDESKWIANDPALVGKVIVNPLTGYPSRAANSAIMGNTSPRDRIGIDFSIRYKDFTVSSVFEFRGGYYAINTTMAAGLDFSGASARSTYYNRERFVFPNSVIQTGVGSDGYPVYSENSNITISDGGAGFWTSSAYNRGGAYSNYVYSGNYWKWRELAVSYQVPKALVSRITAGLVQDVTISAQGRNLLLLLPASNEYTDPDFSANDNNAVGVTTLTTSPPTRYIGGTVSFTF